MKNRLFSFVKKYKIQFASIILAIMLGLIFIVSNIIPPSNFPRNIIVRIPTGTTISEAAIILKEKGIIRSTNIYKMLVILNHSKSGINVGDYLFENSESALTVAHRTAFGIQNIQKKKITIPEGADTGDIAKIIKRSIPDFDSTLFIAEAKKYEGYLFPETYYFFPNVTPSEVIKEMRSVFDDKIAEIQDKIDISGKDIEDIIKMASIIEKEASNDTDRKIISGILWKRIDAGMPLQVDVPFYYSLNKTSSQLTIADLKKDSPYNTYTRKGLPATPITNPGMNSIENAITPTITKYWFFLADKNGATHYAPTYDIHLDNKSKYM